MLGTNASGAATMKIGFDYAYDRAGRQMPTDHASYVEDTIWVAEKPSMNRFTKIPIQARRGLPTRQVPTDHNSYVEDTIRIYGKPAMIRIIILKASRACPAIASRLGGGDPEYFTSGGFSRIPPAVSHSL